MRAASVLVWTGMAAQAAPHTAHAHIVSDVGSARMGSADPDHAPRGRGPRATAPTPSSPSLRSMGATASSPTFAPAHRAEATERTRVRGLGSDNLRWRRLFAVNNSSAEEFTGHTVDFPFPTAATMHAPPTPRPTDAPNAPPTPTPTEITKAPTQKTSSVPPTPTPAELAKTPTQKPVSSEPWSPPDMTSSPTPYTTTSMAPTVTPGVFFCQSPVAKHHQDYQQKYCWQDCEATQEERDIRCCAPDTTKYCWSTNTVDSSYCASLTPQPDDCRPKPTQAPSSPAPSPIPNAAPSWHPTWRETDAPGVEFSMYRNFGRDVVYVSFHYRYSMYGATMGTALLQRSTDGGSTYTTLWSKSGNRGDVWQGANCTLPPTESFQRLKFVCTPGSSYTGDFALDFVYTLARR